ncbi:hypothetical protein JTE90_007484 [Oedothorax gibbosus]|uniref:Uncharacterized protein n=1 Tax=Oedothorax gibbosus TaxID=931172 RepID=A0AAV6TJD2_9ARAC|nr:hypothetical protein JTE90_007484 [Oedothorax gibbosus]
MFSNQDFFGDAEIHIERKISTMVGIYRSLGPLLVKLESITCKTSTGEAAQMRDYYRACEARVLKALIQVSLISISCKRI